MSMSHDEESAATHLVWAMAIRRSPLPAVPMGWLGVAKLGQDHEGRGIIPGPCLQARAHRNYGYGEGRAGGQPTNQPIAIILLLPFHSIWGTLFSIETTRICYVYSQLHFYRSTVIPRNPSMAKGSHTTHCMMATWMVTFAPPCVTNIHSHPHIDPV
jgi:hypothetical protein